MCSRTQYKHNVRTAAQCVEASWTSAFLLPRALTDVLFLVFVPSALRGVQHVTICTFKFCKSFLFACCFSLSWNVSPGFGSEKLGWFGVRGTSNLQTKLQHDSFFFPLPQKFMKSREGKNCARKATFSQSLPGCPLPVSQLWTHLQDEIRFSLFFARHQDEGF